MRQGGCQCGEIRFELEGDPLGGVACHCRACQYVAGGSANLTWVFPSQGFNVTKGNPRCFKAKPTSGGSYFCATCGVHVYSQPDSNDGIIAVKVGALDDATGFMVQADIWTSSAPPWHCRHEGAVQYEQNFPAN